MAIFIITSEESNIETSSEQNLAKARGLVLDFQCKIGNHCINIYKHPDDSRPYKTNVVDADIFFFGSVFYKRKAADKAVELLYQDVMNQKIEPSLLMGSFCIFYFDKNQSCNVITDTGAIYQVYSNAKGDFITNSFLLSTCFEPNKVINEMALNANLLMGYIPYPDTLFNSIIRIQSEDKHGHFSIRRFHDKCILLSSKNYNEHIVYQTERINAYMENLVDTLLNFGVEIGVSGGYDSRLILAMLLNKGLNISAHTHFKKNDPDPLVAKELCELVGIELKLLTERPPLNSQEDFDAILQSSYLQFDGRVNSMMDLGKYEYTRDYRAKLFNMNNITISGVGGEMYRNHNYFNKSKITVDEFIVFYLINHRNWSHMHADKKSDFLDYVKLGLEPVLSDTKYVHYKDSKRYYKSNWLRDWHGTRNTAENHFSSYVSPFADSFLSEAAMQSVEHHGLIGKFEIDLIRAQNASLTKIYSSYGFPFDKVPFVTKQKEYLKIHTPIWLKILLASKFKKKKSHNSLYVNYPFQATYINVLREHNLYFDTDQFIQSSGNTELTYSIGYIINKIK